MRLRSLLYVPAHRPRFVAKAPSSGADAIILDLEDSVPEAEKDAARDGLGGIVAAVRAHGASVFVRINAGARSREDALTACRAGADGLLVPKVASTDTVETVAGWLALEGLGKEDRFLGCIALFETVASLPLAVEIARSRHVLGLALGGEDLALDLGASPVPDVLRLPKLLVHFAAKGAGKLSFGLLQSVADYADIERLSAAAAEARMHGFDGATCIHPSAVPVLNEAFDWTPAERDWAARVVAASAGASGPFTVDGRMVDAPVLARARTILGIR
ncbi:MAG: CoA ester lyase [Burkholderiales bacterium]|nr:CoA ester lyase [Burkholderiales bacterium]